MKYHVKVKAIVVKTYLVEADNEEQAQDLAETEFGFNDDIEPTRFDIVAIDIEED